MSTIWHLHPTIDARTLLTYNVHVHVHTGNILVKASAVYTNKATVMFIQTDTMA